MMIRNERGPDWRRRTMLGGALGGLLFGLLTAWLYIRAAEEETAAGNGPPRVTPRALLGLILTALGLARQIAELASVDPKRTR